MKKGSVLDVLTIILVLAVGITSFYVSTLVLSSISTSINKTSQGQVYAHNSSLVMERGEAAMNQLNLMIPLVVIMAGIAGVAFAFLIPSHPIFFPLSIFTLLFLVVVASIYSDTLTRFTQAPGIVAIANQYSLNSALIANLPFVVAVFGFIICIVMYSRGSVVEV